MIYLIIPYSKVDKNEAYRIATRLTAHFFKSGLEVFSPITYSHNITKMTGKNIDWIHFDLQILSICNAVYVVIYPNMDAINQSVGCMQEIKAALKTGKKIQYIDFKGQIL